MGDILAAGNLHGILGNRFYRCVNRFLNALFDNHGIGAGRDIFQPVADHDLREQSRGGGAVAGHVVGFGRDFLDKLRAHILKRVVQLDFLSNGHAVVCDQGRAVFFVKHDIAAFRADGDLHRIGKFIYAGLKGFSGLFAVNDLFRHN